MKGQKAWNSQQCQQFIKDALDDMGEQGYGFSYSSAQPLKGRTKQMLRKVYLRYNCRNCRKKSKAYRWTSICGTVGIKFQFQKRQQNNKSIDLLVFHFNIYGMRCLTCQQFGMAQIYDSQLQQIERQFCQIISQILNNIPPKRRNRNKNPIKVPQLQVHIADLCQACDLGKCQSSIAKYKRIKNNNSRMIQVDDN